jgi:tyrosine-protein phosphatase SIW14
MLDGEVPIRNFHTVHAGIMRGGQPTHDGYRWLANHGVKTVVSLRWGQKIIAAEREAVKSLGMEFLSIPLNYWNLPDKEIIEDFLALLDTAEKRPIYVHCFHGSDRTGLLMAIHRMARDGWTFDQAYSEMKRFGFHRFRIHHFKWVLWRWASSRENAAAMHPPTGGAESYVQQ